MGDRAELWKPIVLADAVVTLSTLLAFTMGLVVKDGIHAVPGIVGAVFALRLGLIVTFRRHPWIAASGLGVTAPLVLLILMPFGWDGYQPMVWLGVLEMFYLLTGVYGLVWLSVNACARLLHRE